MANPKSAWRDRKPAIIGGLALFLLVGCLGAWGTQAKIGGAVIGKGHVEADTSKQAVQHPVGGVVADLRVRDGDAVVAGDIVLRFDDVEVRTKLNTVEGELFETLAREARLNAEAELSGQLELSSLLDDAMENSPAVRSLVARQQRQLDGIVSALSQKQGAIDQKISQVQKQILAISAQRDAQLAQLEILDGDLERASKLESRGLMLASAHSDIRKEHARAKGEVERFAAKVAELNAKIAELQLERISHPIDMQTKASDELSKLHPLKIKLLESRVELLAKLNQLEVRAPVSGVVHDLQIAGSWSVIVAAKPIMFIVPNDRPVVASVQISANDIDQVSIGQPVSLRFNAFNRRSTPIVEGMVDSVSADAFVNPTTKAYYYQARVTLPRDEIARATGQHLISGMPVEAYFVTTDRTPFSYISKPLVDYFDRAYRD